MSDVQQVIVTIRQPKDGDPGQVAYGAYTFEGMTVMLTDLHGKPVRDDQNKLYLKKLKPGENPKVFAGRLTKKLRLALRGKRAVATGFDGPIAYPKGGMI